MTTQMVKEVPGLYGTLKVREEVIQKIWAGQNFENSGLCTQEGESLQILSPGIWNKAEEGPDFKNAELRINDQKINGDVEVHFNAQDWKKHYHHKDANYERVILHVTLFPSHPNPCICRTSEGRSIPELSLLSKLHNSLEEIMEDQVIECLAGYDLSLPKSFLSDGIVEKIKNSNRKLALERWVQKKEYVRKRLSTGQADQVFHSLFLEVLGYRRNRESMARVAQTFPSDYWAKRKVSHENAFASISDWKLKGLRPANHPRFRLKQYSDLWQKKPNWIESLIEQTIVQPKDVKKTDRKSLGLSKLKDWWQNQITGGIWKGTRSDTIWIDACLPLLSEIHKIDYFSTWFHWYAGDFPYSIRKIAKHAKIAGHSTQKPYSNGTLQGVLGYCIANPVF